MSFKLDENLSRSVAEMFRTQGHDVMTVRDQELPRAHPMSRCSESRFERVGHSLRSTAISVRCCGFAPATSAAIMVIYLGPRATHQRLLERTRELLAMVKTRSPGRSLWIVEPGRVRVHLANDEE